MALVSGRRPRPDEDVGEGAADIDADNATGSLTRRSPWNDMPGLGQVDGSVGRQHDAIIAPRRAGADQAADHVAADRLRIALGGSP